MVTRVFQSDSAEHFPCLGCAAELDSGLLLLENVLVLLVSEALKHPRGLELIVLFVD